MTASPVRTIRKRGTRVVGAPRTRVDSGAAAVPAPRRGAVAVFASRIPHLWPEVGPLCEAPVPAPADPEDEADSLRAAVTARRVDSPGDTGRRPGDELEALLAGWSHFDGERRAVLRGAVRYLAQPSRQQWAVAREESLVDAAVAAVLRHNA